MVFMNGRKPVEAAGMSESRPQPRAIECNVTQPFSKLNRLCREAGKGGGRLTTFKAVAEALDISAGRITQMFGHGQEASGTVLSSKTVGRLVGALRADGVPCEIEWLFLDYDDFAARLAAARDVNPAPARPAAPDVPPAQW